MVEKELSIDITNSRTRVEMAVQTVIGERKELSVPVSLECGNSDVKSVVIISPGFLQTLEDLNGLPFTKSLTARLLDKGYLVVKYEDLGIHGKDDPGYVYYSLLQQAATLNTIIGTVSKQSWFEGKDLFLFGSSAGCHSVLNAFPHLSRKEMVVEPKGVVLISPLVDVVYDIKAYIARDRPLKFLPADNAMQYLYRSRARGRTLDFPGHWALDSEQHANIRFEQLVGINVPLLVVRGKDDLLTDSRTVGRILRGTGAEDRVYDVDHNIDGDSEIVTRATSDIIGFLERS